MTIRTIMNSLKPNTKAGICGQNMMRINLSEKIYNVKIVK